MAQVKTGYRSGFSRISTGFGKVRAKGSAQRKSFPLRSNSYSITDDSGVAFSATWEWQRGCFRTKQTKWRATGRSREKTSARGFLERPLHFPRERKTNSPPPLQPAVLPVTIQLNLYPAKPYVVSDVPVRQVRESARTASLFPQAAGDLGENQLFTEIQAGAPQQARHCGFLEA
jgi:hypothetical protein